QFESNVSLTGANADKRIALTPSQQKKALAKFYAYLNGSSVSADLPDPVDAACKSAAVQVSKAGSRAVVVTGIQDEAAQGLVLAINEALSSVAFDPFAPKLIRQGNTKAVTDLISDMKSGSVGALIMSGVNPAYTLPDAADFLEGLKKVDFSVTFSMKADETATATQYIAAAPHYLESWGDAEIKKGHYSLMQPVIRPLFNTRQFQESLLRWMGISTSYHDYIKDAWTIAVLKGFPWNKALHDGVFTRDYTEVTEESIAVVVEKADVSGIETVPTGAMVRTLAAASSGGMELTLYSKTGMGDGRQANNPWLQEFPDPITRTTWDNYLVISRSDADALGLKNRNVDNGALNGSYVNITAGDVTLSNVPVIIQPGQAKGAVGLAFGYGKTAGLKPEMQTGVNAYTLYRNFNNVQEVTLEKAPGMHEFACVQLHHTLMGRGEIIKETTLTIFNTKDASEWNPVPQVSFNHQEVPAVSVDLWDEFDRSIGHHFNMSIDLNACTGCGACVIACHAENNVPVVGKREVRKSRDMHWLRIDRYYSSEAT
ncbi:MAG: quinol:cytochrome C oxidoreductase, partial [Sinomicrobium sp.]|nr:quinol:cytochrome C oxidoreductase [Sinomicrobium sp.]